MRVKLAHLPRLLKFNIDVLFLDQVYDLDFIITGLPKSGTTWVGRIFSSIPKTYVQMEGAPNSPEKNLREILLNNDLFFDNNVQVLKATREFKKFTLKRATLRKKSLLGYKVPEVIPQALYQIFPDIPTVYLYRDGRDFIVSDAFHNLRLGRIHGDPEKREFWQAAIARRAPFWADMVLNNLTQFREIYGDYLIELRYEDLLNVELGLETIVSIFGRLGLARIVAENAWHQNSFKQLSGGRKQGEEDANSFFRKGIAGDWKNYFSDENMKLFNDIAGEAMLFLGYGLE